MMVSEETRRKLSESMKAYYAANPDAGKRHGDRLRGRPGKPMSEEQKQALSLARTIKNPFAGKKHSPETKARISQSVKAAWRDHGDALREGAKSHGIRTAEHAEKVKASRMRKNQHEAGLPPKKGKRKPPKDMFTRAELDALYRQLGLIE